MTIELGQSAKVFDLAEAREHLPLVQAITKLHYAELAPIQCRLNKMLSNDPRRATIESQYEEVVSTWKTKIEQMGLSVQGLWLVDFDLGEVFLCWRYPEISLNYVRAKDAPLSKRQTMAEYVQKHDPDWK